MEACYSGLTKPQRWSGRPCHAGMRQLRHSFAISWRDAPELCISFPSKTRAQETPGARCTRSLACEIGRTRERSHHRFTGTPGISCAMVLTVSFVPSPVTGLFCHRRSRRLLVENLTPASGRQDHTTSPSALASFVNAPPKHPSHPAPNVRDDRDTPL
jgi:hypothetical protein